MSPPTLGSILKAEPLTTAAAEVIVQSHAVELRPFASMLARFGKEAARDVTVLNRVLLVRNTARLTDGQIARAWQAITGLAKRMRSLAPGPERTLAAFELEQSMQSLLSRKTDYIVPWAEEIEAEVRALRDAASYAAVEAAGNLVKATSSPGSHVLARLAADLEAAAPELIQLWKRFAAVSGVDLARLRAAETAAKFAPAMSRILRDHTLGTVAARQALWGHISPVRGLLGEGYALASPVWTERLTIEIARANELAYRLGPGHAVEYLTQLEHGLRLNGREGPDAIVAIVNRGEKVMYDPARVQVKVASRSEAAVQGFGDEVRRVGQERDRELSSAWYEFSSSLSGSLEAFVVRSRPDIAPSLYLINAGGGRTPIADLAALRALSRSLTEIWLDFTVSQMTHLAISLCESAIKLVKAS
jgi:hypothetical protein